MGIINSTPDSFFDASRHTDIESILKQAEQMLMDGVTILDIGGQSTSPGSIKISAEEEIKRVIEPIKKIAASFPEAYISIDSYYSSVAKEAVAAGASLINDISAGSIDADMITTVSSLKVPYVLMHMQGTPQTMQQEPKYENATREILDFFISRKKKLNDAGIKDVIIDPGFGFGKTIEHNFELLNNLDIFKMLDAPLLLGISRKSMISKTLQVKTADTLNGTTVLNTIGLMKGASILRVHDVKQAKEAIDLFYQAIKTE